MNILKSFIGILTIILINSSVYGQVVNVEKKRKIETNGFQGTMTVGFEMFDNGSNIMQFNNTIDLQYKKNAHTLLLLNNLNFMRIDEENIMNSGFQHLRYNYTLKDSSFLTFELFGQHQYNPIKLLTQRLIAGMGPRFKLFDTPKAQIFVATPVMYEYEKLSDSLTSITRLIRLDFYTSIRWQLSKTLKMKSITYYQPHLSNFADYRISSETLFSFKITNKMAFSTGFEAIFDSDPPEDIQKLFYYWRNKLSYSF